MKNIKQVHLRIIKKFYVNFKKEVSEHRKYLKKHNQYELHIKQLQDIKDIIDTNSITREQFESLSQAVKVWEKEYRKYKALLYLSFNYWSIKRNRVLIYEINEVLKELRINYDF